MNPFFTGGEVISVSFPTSGMTHEQKLMTMRGNNLPFLPGHGPSRADPRPPPPDVHGSTATGRTGRPFHTPFWIEGWALYWEMVLWDKGFPKSPEDRVGLLFWRMHRCARIVFSLKFHLGTDDPGAVHRLPGRPRRPRARERHGRGPPLVQRQLRSPLSMRLHARRDAAPLPCGRSWSTRAR